MKRWVVSGLVFLLTFPLLAFFGFFLVIFVAGPHSDILPEYLASPVFLLILLIVLGVPGWLAYQTFQKLSSSKLVALAGTRTK